MALCLRRIDHRRLWDDPHPEESWLDDRELRADALRDLRTEENKLSIWEVNEEFGIPVNRILAAIAARREKLDKLDFVLFESSLLERLALPFERAAGDTFDIAVNACHFDLIQLTASKLAELGARIRSNGTVKRCPHKQVARLIQESIAHGYIDPGQLKPSLARSVVTQPAA